MFLEQEKLKELASRMGMDFLKTYSDEELSAQFSPDFCLIFFRQREVFSAIFQHLKAKNNVLSYCLEVYASIISMGSNTKGWWQYISEGFIYTFPRHEFLRLDFSTQSYFDNIVAFNRELFSPFILDILVQDDDELWQTLEFTYEAKNNPKTVIKNMELFSRCLESAFILAKERERLCKEMIAQGMDVFAAEEEANAYAFKLTQQSINN